MLWNCCSYLKTKGKTCMSADAITAGLKLHLVTWIYYYTVLGLTETEVPLAQWYQCQKMLTYQAACSRSLASENILICKQNQSWFLQSSGQYQRSTASVQYQDEHGHPALHLLYPKILSIHIISYFIAVMLEKLIYYSAWASGVWWVPQQFCVFFKETKPVPLGAYLNTNSRSNIWLSYCMPSGWVQTILFILWFLARSKG